MATEIGKSAHEAEREIAAQREFFAAFMELMAEIFASLPGSGINIRKGEGLTIERKPKGETLDESLEVTRELPPDRPSREAGTKILYGIGQNNLTDKDIQAIAGIIAGKKGDTIVGGEGLIIKYNGKTLFETDEIGKISLHTKISPEISQKFAALQAGKVSPTLPKPSTPVSPTKNKIEDAFLHQEARNGLQQIMDQVIDRAKQDTAQNEQPPLAQEMTTPDTSPSETVDSPKPKTPERGIQLPPVFEKPVISQPEPVTFEEPIVVELPPQTSPVLELDEEINESLTAVSPTLDTLGTHEATLNSLEDAISNAFVTLVDNLPAVGVPTLSKEQQVEEIETVDLPQEAELTVHNNLQQVTDAVSQAVSKGKQDIQQVTDAVSQVVSRGKQDIQQVTDMVNQVVSRGKEDIQQVADAVDQVASRVTAISDKVVAISDAASNQYMAVWTKLVSKVLPQEDPQLNEYMDTVSEMFDEMEQDDPTLSANNSIREIPLEPIVDQRAIFSRQQEMLDATQPIEKQENILKAAFKIYFRNLPKEQEAVMNSAGNTEVLLPTGAKLLHELTAEGAESLSLEKDGEKILLGGRIGGNYTPAHTLSQGMPGLRELKPFLGEELRLSPEPINLIPIDQPLLQREVAEHTKSQESPQPGETATPTPKAQDAVEPVAETITYPEFRTILLEEAREPQAEKDAAEVDGPPKVQIHLSLTPTIEPTLTHEKEVKLPAQSRGGR